MNILRNIFYAILLGVSMAACLSQQDEATTSASEVTDQTDTLITGNNSNTSAAIPAPANFKVTGKQVGTVKIGMPITELRNNVPAGLAIADTVLTQEGQQSTAYVLRPEGSRKGLLVEQQCAQQCQVWRISVLSQDYKTAKGLGVGSKYGELQKAYNISSVSFEEGNVVAIAPEAGMSFIMDHSQLADAQLGRISVATLPANTLVKKVLVY